MSLVFVSFLEQSCLAFASSLNYIPLSETISEFVVLHSLQLFVPSSAFQSVSLMLFLSSITIRLEEKENNKENEKQREVERITTVKIRKKYPRVFLP